MHAHFSPPRTAEMAAQQVERLREAYWQVDEPPRWDAESTLAYMDRTGIRMQLLSNIPMELEALRDSNDFGASVVADHPDRFGLLAALPTDDPSACLAEVGRADQLGADGFAVTSFYKGTYLSDPLLEPVWAELNRRKAVVSAHPDAYRATMGRPDAVFEVAFQTARTFADMLYSGVFRRYPEIRFIVAHCGGALPSIAGRLQLLGTERWVPNPHGITHTEIQEHLRRLYLDTAGTAPNGLAGGLAMTSPDHLVYGSDCGVPCTTDATMNTNLREILRYDGLTGEQIRAIGRNAFGLFPTAAARIATATEARCR
ncbi:amidohydrolase family protein [Amycolatopsis eburnea]|uniref:amidohydrolase family protein n=1 Tax=Amycolatopsis eburnea TaxID=2267691 RepID=UPI0021F0774F|nr:amidohydrolase family protein [Amycolatopsis eburnea]